MYITQSQVCRAITTCILKRINHSNLCSQNLGETAFSNLIRNAFSTHLTGEIRMSMDWAKRSRREKPFPFCNRRSASNMVACPAANVSTLDSCTLRTAAGSDMGGAGIVQEYVVGAVKEVRAWPVTLPLRMRAFALPATDWMHKRAHINSHISTGARTHWAAAPIKLPMRDNRAMRLVEAADTPGSNGGSVSLLAVYRSACAVLESCSSSPVAWNAYWVSR